MNVWNKAQVTENSICVDKEEARKNFFFHIFIPVLFYNFFDDDEIPLNPILLVKRQHGSSS